MSQKIRKEAPAEVLLDCSAQMVRDAASRRANEELIWMVGDHERQMLPEEVLKKLLQEGHGRTVAFTLGRAIPRGMDRQKA
jgi:hypothetical protein